MKAMNVMKLATYQRTNVPTYHRRYLHSATHVPTLTDGKTGSHAVFRSSLSSSMFLTLQASALPLLDRGLHKATE